MATCIDHNTDRIRFQTRPKTEISRRMRSDLRGVRFPTGYYIRHVVSRRSSAAWLHRSRGRGRGPTPGAQGAPASNVTRSNIVSISRHPETMLSYHPRTWAVVVVAIIVSPGSAWSTHSQLELRHGHGVVAGARYEREHVVPIISRRQAAAGLLTTFAAGLPRGAAAFENGIPDMELYRKQPKYMQLLSIRIQMH